MAEKGLKQLEVIFYRDPETVLRTYATFATLGGSAERSPNAQFQLVLETLREKHGSPSLIPPWRSSTNSGTSYELIASDMDELLGIECGIPFFLNTSTLAWARNLIVFADVHLTGNSGGITLNSPHFLVLYYDHQAVSYVRDLYAKAIADFEKDYHAKKGSARAAMKQDF